MTPGLHKHERRWALLFVCIATPLFLAGVVAGIRGASAHCNLFDFTPNSVANFLPVDAYLSFFTRLVLVFGVGFLTPLLIVALNLLGDPERQDTARLVARDHLCRLRVRCGRNTDCGPHQPDDARDPDSGSWSAPR